MTPFCAVRLGPGIFPTGLQPLNLQLSPSLPAPYAWVGWVGALMWAVCPCAAPQTARLCPTPPSLGAFKMSFASGFWALRSCGFVMLKTPGASNSYSGSLSSSPPITRGDPPPVWMHFLPILQLINGACPFAGAERMETMPGCHHWHGIPQQQSAV